MKVPGTFPSAHAPSPLAEHMHTLAKSGPRPGSWVASCCAGRPRERRASQVRSAVPQTVAAAAAKGGPYTAVNRYRVVEDAALAAFHAELASRKAHAASQVCALWQFGGLDNDQL